MKKAVITILGIQGAKYSEHGEALVKNYSHQATYYIENTDNTIKYYYNTLEMLIELYSDQYEIVPIYTNEAKKFNQNVLKYSNYHCTFNDTLGFIENEKDYFSIFNKIDKVINTFDTVIIDLTHGFRHLPILAIIDIIIQNFKDTNKIEKILFAKEIIKHTPENIGEYEVVDLKEYLDIANISYILSSFEQNYTLSHHIKTKDKDFQVLLDMLSKFSEHILANSLITLLQKENSLIDKLSQAIDIAIQHPKSKPLKFYLRNIKEHLNKFIGLKEKPEYIQLFELSKLMKEKGYFLNSITLLNEAVSWYCANSVAKISPNYNSLLTKAKKNTYDIYEVLNAAKNIVKFTNYQERYKNTLKLSDINEIYTVLTNIKNIENFSKKLLQNVDRDRNNLAHANSSNALSEIKKRLETLLGRFQTYCIEDDILKKSTFNTNDLINKYKK